MFSRRVFFLAAMLLALCAAGTAFAEDAEDTDGASTRPPSENECDSYPDVPIHITPVFDDPVYDYGTNLATLQQLSRDIHHSIHESITMGLTRYQPILEFHVPIRSVQFPDGLTCAHVDHVDVIMGYHNVTVYVADEIPQGTCGFNEVLAHEMKHVAVNRAILAEYQPLIEGQLKDYLRDNGVFREPNPDYAMQLLHEKVEAILQGLIQKMETDNIKRQQAVDSPQEYRRLSNVCGGQVALIAQRFRVTGE